MVTATTSKPSVPKPQQTQTIEQKIQQLRDLFADAPELGKKALENALRELKSQASDLPPPVESAGRVGARPRNALMQCSTTGRIRSIASSEVNSQIALWISPQCHRSEAETN